MGVKLGLSHWRKATDWECLETGYWGTNLDLTGRPQGEDEQNIIRVSKSRTTTCAGHLVAMGDVRNALQNLVGKSERYRPCM